MKWITAMVVAIQFVSVGMVEAKEKKKPVQAYVMTMDDVEGKTVSKRTHIAPLVLPDFLSPLPKDVLFYADRRGWNLLRFSNNSPVEEMLNGCYYKVESFDGIHVCSEEIRMGDECSFNCCLCQNGQTLKNGNDYSCTVPDGYSEKDEVFYGCLYRMWRHWSFGVNEGRVQKKETQW